MSKQQQEIKERLEKLRSLREKLCSQGSNWSDGFAARDYLVSELEDVRDMLENPKVRKKQVLVKINRVLDLLNPPGGKKHVK